MYPPTTRGFSFGHKRPTTHPLIGCGTMGA